MSRFNRKEAEAFIRGLHLLSDEDMRELLFNILNSDVNSIEDCVEFAFTARTSISSKILEVTSALTQSQNENNS